ncbi:MAG: glycoside hydrolase family 127 protein [Caldilineaceae bacterium]
MQDHLPVVVATRRCRSARRLHAAAGMADVSFPLTGDAAYIAALDRLWENVVGRKLYLTGGIGARHHGEAFGDDYELPNATAYTRICCAEANGFLNPCMFLLHGHGKYIDVLERTLYNGFLSGISQGGDEFFYANPLASDGEWFFNYGTAATRSPWFSCSCCPTNVVRLLGSLGSYIYAQRNGDLYVNLFVGGGTTVNLNGVDVGVTQWTHYPWDGNVTVQLDPAEETEFTLRVRVPGWALGQAVPSDLYHYVDARPDVVALLVNGDLLDVEVVDGYAAVTRTWKHGDSVTLAPATPVRPSGEPCSCGRECRTRAPERGPVHCVRDRQRRVGRGRHAAGGRRDHARVGRGPGRRRVQAHVARRRRPAHGHP